MGTRDAFRSAWQARFPGDPTPELSCLSQDPSNQPSSWEKSFTIIQNRIASLRKELKQQEFMAVFVKDVINNPRCNPCETMNGASSDLDLDVPVGEEVLAPDEPEGEFYKNVVMHDVGRSGSGTYDNAGWKKPVLETDLDSLEEPGCRGSLTDSEKVKILEKSNDPAGVVTLDRNKRPPVPAPRPSIKGPNFRRGLQYGSLRTDMTGMLCRQESAESTQSLPVILSPDEPQEPPLMAHTTATVPMLKPLKKRSENDTDPQPDSGAEPPPLPATIARCGSNKYPHNYANLDIGINRQLSEGCSQRTSKDGGDQSGRLHSNVYDDAVPVNKEEADVDTSSDEEEPIYYNLMLMKTKTLQKTSMQRQKIYASVDMQEKDLEKKAKRLSKRFSQSADGGLGATSGAVVGKLTPCASDEELERAADFVDLGEDLSTCSTTDDSDSVFMYSPTLKNEGAAERKGSTHTITYDEPPEPKWKRRDSMIRATDVDAASTGSASSEAEEEAMPALTVEQEKLQMRKWVVTSILDSEHNYAMMLDKLLQYMHSLKSAAESSQPLISIESINIIFCKIPELHEIHCKFIHDLEPKVENWDPNQEVAAIFKMLAIAEYPIASEYLKNYQRAVAEIRSCAEENPKFAELTKSITCKGMPEESTLEELLHKPVVRIQRNTLVLHDLIRCTPTSHVDFDLLQKTLKVTQQFLDNFQSPMDMEDADTARYMVKNVLLVEKVGNNRKLRQVFLFNDVFVCTKQKLKGRQKLHFDVKFFIPLQDLVVEPQNNNKDNQQAQSIREEVLNLQDNVRHLKSEIRQELKKQKDRENDGQSRNWSIRGGMKNIEKKKKKLTDQEVALMKLAPNLPFTVRNKQKAFTFLMSSDYERNDWKEAILGLKGKVREGSSLTAVALQNTINSLDMDKVHDINNFLEKDDWMFEEDQLFGSLNVTLHKIQGVKASLDAFCSIEIDSYGHFSLEATSQPMSIAKENTWNQDFEVNLHGAQTLRILCYKIEGSRNILLGKCALELSKSWLSGDFQETTISLNQEVSVVLSLSYASRDQTIKRTPSHAKGGLFGVRIATVTKRESTRVPLIISKCVQEVERRGMYDVGIYRISGLSSEVQRLKKAFERNARGALPLLMETDINVVTGLLKLYLRELPEALFTDKLYSHFVEGMALSDPEAKQKCMMSLFRALPEPNFSTAMYLLDHMVLLSENASQNKMSLQNLATVFGPTLLRPATKTQATNAMDLFSAGARDAMMQTTILYFFLTLKVKKVDFRR